MTDELISLLREIRTLLRASIATSLFMDSYSNVYGAAYRTASHIDPHDPYRVLEVWMPHLSECMASDYGTLGLLPQTKSSDNNSADEPSDKTGEIANHRPDCQGNECFELIGNQ